MGQSSASASVSVSAELRMIYQLRLYIRIRGVQKSRICLTSAEFMNFTSVPSQLQSVLSNSFTFVIQVVLV